MREHIASPFRLCCLFLLVPFASSTILHAQAASELRLTYTGFLGGYYRTDVPAEGRAPIADFIARHKDGNSLLVGMGDNFAPEFGASIQVRNYPPGAFENLATRDARCLVQPDTGPGKKFPTDLYKTGKRVAPHAQCDNVVHFLLTAGYRAIVPGELDFIYGAAWLRQTALNLQNKADYVEGWGSSTCGAPPNFALGAREGLNLLAANLLLQPSGATNSAKCLLFSQEQGAKPPSITAKDQPPSCAVSTIGKGVSLAGADLLSLLDDLGRLDVASKLKVSERNEYLKAVLHEPAFDAMKLFSAAPLPSAEFDSKLEESEESILHQVWQEEAEVGFTIAAAGTPNATLVIGVVGKDVFARVSKSNATLCRNASSLQYTGCEDGGKTAATVTAAEPLPVIMALLRAVPGEQKQNVPKNVVILAQMSRGEAESLAAHIRAERQKFHARHDTHIVDEDTNIVVISEADPKLATNEIDASWKDSALGAEIPVLTPYPMYGTVALLGGADAPYAESTATLSRTKGRSALLVAQSCPVESAGRAESHCPHPAEKRQLPTAGELLLTQLADRGIVVEACGAPSEYSVQSKELHSSACEQAIMRAILAAMTQTKPDSRADVAVLPRRDFYLGALPPGYEGYEVCQNDLQCRLQVAIDRVLWAGDSLEKIMVSGSDIANLIKASQSESDLEAQLNTSDLFSQWLMTFGIVIDGESTSQQKAAAAAHKFSLPTDSNCQGAGKGTTCINGEPIQNDRAYWLVTTDHLAEGTPLYPGLAGLPTGYSTGPQREVAEHLAATIFHGIPQRPVVMQTLEQRQQGRPLNRVEIAKAVVAYNLRSPNGGNRKIADYQGVSNSSANTPRSDEVDIEGKVRYLYDRRSWALGAQTELAYDRSMQGNLSSNVVNPTYNLNLFDAGPFVQLRIPQQYTPGIHWLHYANNFGEQGGLMVLGVQYHQQVVNNPIYFAFTNSSAGQLTMRLPRATGYLYHFGFREEAGAPAADYQFEKGSYFEVGVRGGQQYKSVYAGTFYNGPPATATEMVVCNAAANQTIGACLKSSRWIPVHSTDPVNSSGAKLTVDANTVGVASMADLWQSNLYWDISLKKALKRKGSKDQHAVFTLESQGDWNFYSGKALSTIARYQVPISLGIDFPVFRNLKISPTYTGFAYQTFGPQSPLWVNKYTVKLSWYFDRDSGVPFGRQLRFLGPSSQDQTKSARMK